MIASEILVGAGLASRELTLLDGKLTIHLCASASLKNSLEILQRDQGKKVDRAKDRLPLPQTTGRPRATCRQTEGELLCALSLWGTF